MFGAGIDDSTEARVSRDEKRKAKSDPLAKLRCVLKVKDTSQVCVCVEILSEPVAIEVMSSRKRMHQSEYLVCRVRLMWRWGH